VDDGVNAFKSLADTLLIGDISFDDLEVAGELAESGREVVIDEGSVSPVCEFKTHGAADIAGSAGHEYFHLLLWFSGLGVVEVVQSRILNG
jgi:hypothetical protein